MCYSKLSVSSPEEFKEYMHLRTEEFIDDVIATENQEDDSPDLEDMKDLACKHKGKIQQFFLDIVDANFRRRNQVHATYSISKELGLEDWIKNDEENSKLADLPRKSGSILERALAIWDEILKKVKNLWEKLLTWLKEMLSALKDMAISLWEGAVYAVKTVWEWLKGLF